jgi:hypothetical protein
VWHPFCDGCFPLLELAIDYFLEGSAGSRLEDQRHWSSQFYRTAWTSGWTMATRASARALANEKAAMSLRRRDGKRDANSSDASQPTKRQRNALGNITNKTAGLKVTRATRTLSAHLTPHHNNHRVHCPQAPDVKPAARPRRKSARTASEPAASTADVLALVPAAVSDLQADDPLPPHVRDIDAGEEDDPTLVAVYTKSVYRHLLEVEVSSAPCLSVIAANLSLSFCRFAAKISGRSVIHGHSAGYKHEHERHPCGLVS